MEQHPPLQSDTKRSLYVNYGLSITVTVIAAYISRYLVLLVLVVGVGLILYGHFPNKFKNRSVQLIATCIATAIFCTTVFISPFGKKLLSRPLETAATIQPSVPSPRPPQQPLAKEPIVEQPPIGKTKPKTSAHLEPPVQPTPSIQVDQSGDGDCNARAALGGTAVVGEGCGKPNPNNRTKTYTCDGWSRTSGPGSGGGLSLSMDGTLSIAYEQMRQLGAHEDWDSLLVECTKQIAANPDWLTPYLFCSDVYRQRGDTAKARSLLAYFDAKKGDIYTEPLCAGLDSGLRKMLDPQQP